MNDVEGTAELLREEEIIDQARIISGANVLIGGHGSAQERHGVSNLSISTPIYTTCFQLSLNYQRY